MAQCREDCPGDEADGEAAMANDLKETFVEKGFRVDVMWCMFVASPGVIIDKATISHSVEYFGQMHSSLCGLLRTVR